MHQREIIASTKSENELIIKPTEGKKNDKEKAQIYYFVKELTPSMDGFMFKNQNINGRIKMQNFIFEIY